MNSEKIKVACAAVFAMATISGHAQTTSNSNSSAQSASNSVSIGQGGGSSLNNINTTTSSRGGNAQGGDATSNSSSQVRGSGNSNVQVSVSLPSNGTSSSPAASLAAQDVGTPGSSPYNTQTTDNVNYSGTQTIKTNPTIQAPGLTTTLSDTCMGSLSIGLSLPGFGATGGTTLVDQACVRRLDAREFRAMGLTDVALALLCQSDANRRAVEATGHLCPGTTAPLARSNGAANVEAIVVDDEKYRDPLVRQRLGLPPLDVAGHNATAAITAARVSTSREAVGASAHVALPVDSAAQMVPVLEPSAAPIVSAVPAMVPAPAGLPASLPTITTAPVDPSASLAEPTQAPVLHHTAAVEADALATPPVSNASAAKPGDVVKPQVMSTPVPNSTPLLSVEPTAAQTPVPAPLAVPVTTAVQKNEASDASKPGLVAEPIPASDSSSNVAAATDSDVKAARLPSEPQAAPTTTPVPSSVNEPTTEQNAAPATDASPKAASTSSTS
ncbi:hypothetical protein [Burkholderia sp. MSMB617WGS]|uniref:hypothetical protein n=1 Tax=Burkholderia sp. MSMB617WGS TaxID=1637831 RepID=UPI0009EA8EF9|nr:hypothetical protein [Burkholderia sp. MSMB617WGS]